LLFHLCDISQSLYFSIRFQFVHKQLTKDGPQTHSTAQQIIFYTTTRYNV